MNVRAICEGRFTLPMRPGDALPLFTPEGERLWTGHAWDPVYAIEGASEDGGEPGTVFTTESHGGPATWVVTERDDDVVAYARIVPGRLAGTVRVTCSQGAVDDECRVTVRYDVTSLDSEGAAFVEELRVGYDAFLESWRAAILSSHDARGTPGDH